MNETATAFLATLRHLGLQGIERCCLTRNRRVMVSYRGADLRVHAAFVTAPVDVQRAVVGFVNGQGSARRRARNVILSYPIPHPEAPLRREGTHADDLFLVRRLLQEHATLNGERFGDELRQVRMRVSRRMRRRLGSYHPAASAASAGEIVISRRHIRRHGWNAVLDTLLHEMVHQWQDERGLPLDHRREFRRKAREVRIDLCYLPAP